MTDQFTWIPFYHEVAMEVLGREQKQHELLELLKQAADKSLKVVSLNDLQNKQGELLDQITIPLSEIDPFTFFASFNRNTNDRKALCAFIKEVWNLSADVPQDFNGVPTINSQKA